MNKRPLCGAHPDPPPPPLTYSFIINKARGVAGGGGDGQLLLAPNALHPRCIARNCPQAAFPAGGDASLQPRSPSSAALQNSPLQMGNVGSSWHCACTSFGFRGSALLRLRRKSRWGLGAGLRSLRGGRMHRTLRRPRTVRALLPAHLWMFCVFSGRWPTGNPPPVRGKNFPLYGPIFSTIRMLLSKGTTIRLGQRQKSNSFSILGVAYITRHSLVKSIGEGRKKRQMGA